MPKYGADIARAALREIGVIDVLEPGGPELIANTIEAATDMLDSWRTENDLLVPAIIGYLYSLVANTQDYTIGDGGDFDQAWPTAIESWSVIPDDDAAQPLEQPRGKPLTWQEWQGIGVKALTAKHPTRMFFDRNWDAGLGQCSFWPIPDNNDVDVRLYQAVPALTTLVEATLYSLRPGVLLALQLNLAIEIAERNGVEVSDKLERRATRAIGRVRRANYVPRRAPLAAGFSTLGSGRRRALNIYTDS
jgi:hypothetical protein